MNSVMLNQHTAESVLQRENGAEVRIVAELGFSLGLKPNVFVHVHRREGMDQPWKLLSDKPHPDWRNMPLDEYVKHGRSEVLQAVTHGEIFKVTNALTPLIEAAGYTLHA